MMLKSWSENPGERPTLRIWEAELARIAADRAPGVKAESKEDAKKRAASTVMLGISADHLNIARKLMRTNLHMSTTDCLARMKALCKESSSSYVDWVRSHDQLSKNQDGTPAVGPASVFVSHAWKI